MDNNIYIVKSGDTLYDIAKRFHTDVVTLAEFNGIPDPDAIRPGQIIRIPDNGQENCVPIYIIKSGDTLYDIARRYGTTAAALAELNNIADPDYIEAGRILRLPPDAKCRIYRVQDGDSLWKIARMHNVTVTQLINENRLRDPSLIYPGQILRIPV